MRTETLQQIVNINEVPLNISLSHEALNMREDFNNLISNRINNENNRLPSVPIVENIDVIDRETIFNINNSTTSERRDAFMHEIITNTHSAENRMTLLENSNDNVHSYINQLLIRVSSNENVQEIDLYRIGNIFLYTLSNLTDVQTFRDIITPLQESYVIYSTHQVLSIPPSITYEYRNILDSIGLLTEEHLSERTDEFHKQVEEKMIVNRRRILMVGAGILATTALSTIGVPPIGGLIVRGISNVVETTSEVVPPTTSSIRLRDLFDQTLVNIYNYIK